MSLLHAILDSLRFGQGILTAARLRDQRARVGRWYLPEGLLGGR